MYLIFTTPIQFANSYTIACNIADAHYQSTGEIVAVELSQPHPSLEVKLCN
mgnify:FL=1